MDRPFTFAQRLQELLDRKGMTKSELAVAADINKSNITRYLKGDYEAKQDVVHRIAVRLDVSESWLMGYDVPMQKESPPALVNNDPELTEILERTRDDPHLRMLFSVTKNATAEDIEKAIKIIQMLKGE